MSDEEPSAVLFRASKRRKVTRKPAHADTEDSAPAPLDQMKPSNAGLPPHDDEGTRLSTLVQAKKKTGAARPGISFSSTEAERAIATEPDEDRALVLATEDPTAGIDRFVRPQGKVQPVEDRHMMAYVDSQLAKLRPNVNDAPAGSTINLDSAPTTAGAMSEATSLNTTTGLAGITASAQKEMAPPTTRLPQQRQPPRARDKPRRRQPPARPEGDVARDSMIEQIMGEGQVQPHYQQPAATPAYDAGEGDEDVDRDVAAANAFKAQLIADMQQRRRRPPPAKNAATTSSGPKLGGSRSQREKMKALEEAKVGKK